MYILCICTSASYEVMRRCSIKIQRYAPPGQESCVGQKKSGRFNQIRVLGLAWDASCKGGDDISCDLNHTISDLHQWMLPMCQDLPITSKLKSSEAWQTSSRLIEGSPGVDILSGQQKSSPHFKDQRSTQRKGKLHDSTGWRPARIEDLTLT